MKTEITINNIVINESGTVEVEVLWNGGTHGAVYSSAEALQSDVASIIANPGEAIRWVLHYTLSQGVSVAELPSQIGKKLVHEVKPATATTIALV